MANDNDCNGLDDGLIDVGEDPSAVSNDFCGNEVGFPFRVEGSDLFAMQRNNNGAGEVYISGQGGLGKKEICDAMAYELRTVYHLPDEDIKRWTDLVDLDAKHPHEFLNFAGSYISLEDLLKIQTI